MTRRLHPEVLRMGRFGIVGVSNTLLTLVTFTLLVRAGTAPPVASALAFAAGAVNGYVLNRRWTFQAARGGAGTLARYVAVQGVGAGVSALGVALATTDLDVARIGAEVLVLPFVAVLTYLLSSRVVFSGPETA
jgi:putative flippase GtrA